ncbi:GTP-binding domain protein [Heliomicrobium modesticaldum Ice1]|uniref:Ferrous iron transport protein B n=1 Tax=Heliobacterium modesticaldum (strain ATCC 51547 / Ice1) TaxID=498761 RepID=B0TCG2_HELMI|nr:ferrous iron transport protein B [Heliomicrobium modesticaldum]ABZ85350.1 GTP-binding domain protein [Heliomicrobium modesticaldum Ice1]
MAATCHGAPIKLNIGKGEKKLVLAGNPNVGKSVFFNHLTGMYVDVSNYPGTTLDISHGRYKDWVVMDTPGIYGLSSFNDEERIARDVILQADLVLNIVNALHLERDLFLSLQIIDTGVPVVIAVNMVDEAKRRGIHIDFDGLSRELGVPVVPSVAVKGQGLKEVEKALADARPGRTSAALAREIDAVAAVTANRGEALLALEGDEGIRQAYRITAPSRREEIYLERRQRVNEICQAVVTETTQGANLSVKLGYWMVRPITGIPILAAVLYFMYQLIGVWVAGDIVGLTEEGIFLTYYEPFVRNLLTPVIDPESAIGTILFGEFGLLTMTITYVFGLLLPLVVAFYLSLSTLEDSGYLPRVAALTDRVLNYLGLNGRAVIPLILGFGCVTLATITTRLLASEREKRIAIFLLGLAIPCSAQLGVITGILAAIEPAFVFMYVLIILSILIGVGMIMDRVIPGRSSDLLIELPPIRLPRLVNVLKKTGIKSFAFVKEALPLFALGSLIISVLSVTGALESLQDALAPLTVGWLGLPKETATVFIMGLVRRDFGAAGLADMTLEPHQAVVALAVITLFVPCIATVLILFKERSKKEALIMWLSTWIIAFLVGGIVAQLYAWLEEVYLTVAVFAGLMGMIVGAVLLLAPKKRGGCVGDETCCQAEQA